MNEDNTQEEIENAIDKAEYIEEASYIDEAEYFAGG